MIQGVDPNPISTNPSSLAGCTASFVTGMRRAARQALAARRSDSPRPSDVPGGTATIEVLRPDLAWPAPTGLYEADPGEKRDRKIHDKTAGLIEPTT